MTSKKEVNSELDYLGNLRLILETYEEIAASRMARIRSTVLKNRDFLLEINSIFQQIKASYKDKIDLLMKRKRIKDPKELTFLKRNNKTLQVFISANTSLYGEIIRRTYGVFVENVKKEKSDVAIIGRLGYELFQEEKINVPLTYFDFPDDMIDNNALRKIVEHIIQYEKVLVYYERFNNVINQEPIITNISGDPLPWEKPGPVAKYFFEPSLEKIMEFFEKEIVASIFEQTLMESQLAKFSSRMVALDAASENTKKRLLLVEFMKEKIKHQQINRSQNERYSSMLLWKKYG